jgi:SAM-dependent methyltransferase
MGNRRAAEIPKDFEVIPCPICGSDDVIRHLQVDDRLNFTSDPGILKPQDSTFTVVACQSCGFLYLNPRPTAEILPDYYRTEGYDPHRREGGGFLGLVFRWVRPMMVKWKTSRVTLGLPRGRLLDVGCGTGEFLIEMQQLGWNATGIELDADAASIATFNGCRVLVGDPAYQHLQPGSFDLITMWHSLEHLSNLKASVSIMSNALRSGGRLAIALPNPGSMEAKFYRSKWVAWDAPRHLYHFTRKDLTALFEPFGFRWQKTYTLPLDPFYHCLLSEISWSSGLAGKIRMVRGLLLGGISFLVGMKPEWGSACLYILKKD